MNTLGAGAPDGRVGRDPPDQARLGQLAEEQAALRRVATLVARGEPPEAVFAAVAEEVGQVIPGADFALVGRYDATRVVEVAGGWARAGSRGLAGLRAGLGGQTVSTLVFERNECSRVSERRESRRRHSRR